MWLRCSTRIKSVKVLGSVNDEIRSFAGSYDVDETTPANGYRSFVYVVERAIEKTFDIARRVQENRGKLFFRRKFYEK
jgi:hormone-sensitive lipase